MYFARGQAERRGPLIQRLIEEDHVAVNGHKVKSNHKLKGTEDVTITFPPPTEVDILPEDIPVLHRLRGRGHRRHRQGAGHGGASGAGESNWYPGQRAAVTI